MNMSDDAAARIGRAFARVGWTGLCLQGVLIILPLLMLGYVIFGKVAGVREPLDFTEYLAFVGLLILAFTTFWSFYYTRVARRIEDPARRPTWDSIIRILWIGLWASCLGIVVSLLSLFIEVTRLLILFLKAPQAGVPVMRTQLETPTEWVSALDAVGLLAEVCTLAGEFLLLGLTLWLLFKITWDCDYQRASMQVSEIGLRGAQGSENTGAST
jgi:Protein of unknown function (DUF3611)